MIRFRIRRAEGDMEQLILAVDDEAPARELYLDVFAEAGFKVHAVRDVMDAVKFLDGNFVDLVVTDIRMPGSSGLALVPWIATHRREIPVIVVSAYSEYEPLLKGGEGCVKAFFLKPVDLNELVAKAFEVLGIKR